ncbi:MAG: 16S rRNA (guanine(527)-N(7))-methyltransferase RsmG [Opitutaceae bacterium]|jgi:16S rRNA (guanine527-N7)-methyltransferase|nr:16S rRNA (guanine(527)-N(7))-methyltransferase RsmG [Opitutaceae bacterium]
MSAAADDTLAPLPPVPDHASARLSVETIARLTSYGDALASDGVIRGLIGPREVPILWDRHLLNCAAMAEAVERDARIVDIGTGAGLPGLVLALVRDDIQVVLIETLQRRCDFLSEMVEKFELQSRVTVVWGRAEEVPPQEADIVTSRAVAALKKLIPWCMPHVRIGGRLLAMKGQKAGEELQAARKSLHKWSAAKHAELLTCGTGWIDPPVTLVSATRGK